MIRSLRLDIWSIEIMSYRGSGLFLGIFYFAQIISFTVKLLTNTSAVFYRKSFIFFDLDIGHFGSFNFFDLINVVRFLYLMTSLELGQIIWLLIPILKLI